MSENNYQEYEPFYSRDGELVTDILYFEAAYCVTENPLYVWEAISYAGKHGENIPTFAMKYLVDCSNKILGIDDYTETRKISGKIVNEFMGIKASSYSKMDEMNEKLHKLNGIAIFEEFIEPKSHSTLSIDNGFQKFLDDGCFINKTDLKKLMFRRESEESVNKCYNSCKKQEKIKRSIFKEFDVLRGKT